MTGNLESDQKERYNLYRKCIKKSIKASTTVERSRVSGKVKEIEFANYEIQTSQRRYDRIIQNYE